MSAGNMKVFSDMFAPFDENYAQDLAERAALTKTKQSDSIDGSSSQMALPSGLDKSFLEQI